MTKVVTIDNATFDVAKLTQFMQRAHNLLDEQQVLKEDYKTVGQRRRSRNKIAKEGGEQILQSTFR